MNYLSLNGNWEMNKKNDSTIVQASVPGSVYNDLLNYYWPTVHKNFMHRRCIKYFYFVIIIICPPFVNSYNNLLTK